MTPARLLVLCVLLALAAPAVAAAGTPPASIATPSGNIGCIAAGGVLRCDVRVSRAPVPPRPASCEFDWGNAFEMTPRGRARRLCASDTALPGRGTGHRVLAYGRSRRIGPFRCASARVGLTCRNRAGHGWFLSRERIRLF
jgi:hypothetical protein